MISQIIDGGATEADGGASAPVGPSVATPLPPFLSTGHCEFNGAHSCAHVRKTVPIPLILKFSTFIVPSINIESISPMMKRCHLSSFSSS